MAILWIGGATDAGKTTLARSLAARFGCELYEYDRTDGAHHAALAAQHQDIRAFMLASMGRPLGDADAGRAIPPVDAQLPAALAAAAARSWPSCRPALARR